jgi:hypothetical protein
MRCAALTGILPLYRDVLAEPHMPSPCILLHFLTIGGGTFDGDVAAASSWMRWPLALTPTVALPSLLLLLLSIAGWVIGHAVAGELGLAWLPGNKTRRVLQLSMPRCQPLPI